MRLKIKKNIIHIGGPLLLIIGIFSIFSVIPLSNMDKLANIAKNDKPLLLLGTTPILITLILFEYLKFHYSHYLTDKGIEQKGFVTRQFTSWDNLIGIETDDTYYYGQTYKKLILVFEKNQKITLLINELRNPAEVLTFILEQASSRLDIHFKLINYFGNYLKPET